MWQTLMQTYIATNTEDGKFYIGSTINFEKRKKAHLGGKENYPFQNALRKNPDVFEWEVFEDENNEPILEQALLDMWFGAEQCYNLNPSASRPPQLPREVNQALAYEKALKMMEEGRGVTARTPEQMTIDAKKGRSKLTREVLVKGGKTAGKLVSNQKWIDPDHPELGEHSAATLARMQKARGFPYGRETRVRIK